MTGQIFRRAALVFVVSGLSFGLVRAQESSTKAAQAAIEAWLALTDNQSYAASWDAAAELFRNAITREKWSAALEEVRTPLGKVKSRTLTSATPTTTPPGAPHGEYVVFQFNTNFEQRSAAAETVTAFKETDGRWRAVGYFIK